jgi:hypothetical protein
MSAAGAVLFARYAYPPNELGYCGPAWFAPDSRWARQFEGAWGYLEAIADAAGLADPLDARVVEAYWIGNDLLDRVAPGPLLARLRERFAGQPGGTWRDAGDRAVAHHTFQVFEVYPWVELLRRAGNPVAASVLDRCRIRTGTVLAVQGETATVRCRPLIARDGELSTGPERDEVVRWSAALLPGVAVGERVALHWDWLCDVLTESQCARLESLEERFTAARPSASSAP